jgi:co-chaperonin GroES (HSP10)
VKIVPINGHVAFMEVVVNNGMVAPAQEGEEGKGVTLGKVLAVGGDWTGVTGHRHSHRLKKNDLFVPPIQYVSVKIDGNEVCFCREEDAITKLDEDVLFNAG